MFEKLRLIIAFLALPFPALFLLLEAGTIELLRK